jgi:transcriptional regulator with XRE-family HTH domain
MRYTEISKKTGLSISHISRVHRGLTGVSLNVLLKIARARGIDVEDLIDEIGRNRMVEKKVKAHQ